MKAIILAGGQAKRLRPLTRNRPKCLLKVRGKTILDYQIEALLKNGLREFIIVSGPFTSQLRHHIKKYFPEIDVRYLNNKRYETTGPAFGLNLSRKYLTGSVLYLNSDVLFEPKIVEKIMKSRHPSVTAIQKTPWDEEEVNVIIDKKNRVIEIGKQISKDLSCGEFIGITKFDSSFNRKLVLALADFVKEGFIKKFAADAVNLAIQRGGKIYAVDVSKFKAMEVDTIEDYQEAKKLWNYSLTTAERG